MEATPQDPQAREAREVDSKAATLDEWQLYDLYQHIKRSFIGWSPVAVDTRHCERGVRDAIYMPDLHSVIGERQHLPHTTRRTTIPEGHWVRC